KACVKALAHKEDPDILWSAVPAVARCARDNAEAVAALKKLARFLMNPPAKLYEEAPNYEPDVHDEPLLRARCILEMTLIALARPGDADGKKELEKLLAEEPADVSDAPRAGRRGFRRTPLASKGTFGTLHAPALVLLVETLPSLGDNGRKRLETVA